MGQNGLPLGLVWNPGDRGENRNKAPLSPTNAFSNRIDGIPSMAKSNAPLVKVAHSTHTSSDRRRCQVRPGNVGNLASAESLPIASLRFPLPQPIHVVSNLAFIGFEQFRKRGIGKGRQEIIEIAAVVLDGTLGFSFLSDLLNERSCDRVLSH